MKKTALFLKTIFFTSIVASLLIIVLFETDLLMAGLWAGNISMEFYFLMTSELVTICVVPLSLWMFRAKSIKKTLVVGREQALIKYGGLRISLLAIPMVANTLLYYIFMLPSFGYLAIIIFLSMFFVLPTMDRCLQDVSE